MPTFSTSQIRPPKSWDEFEEIVLSAAKARWRSPDFFRNGRPGQKQDGVDIFSDAGEKIGIQCKNTSAGISLSVVTSEIVNAESFSPARTHLYVATSAPRDASLQLEVRKISEARTSQGKCRVDVLFWDDVVADLAKDPKELIRHFPDFSFRDEGKEHDRALWNELQALLHSDGVIGFINEANMAGFSFESKEIAPLRDFAARWSVPEREFVSGPIETSKQTLLTKASQYLRAINKHTFPAGVGRLSVPSEWEIEQPEKFDNAVEELHTLAGEIVELHGHLVRIAKKELLG